MTSVKPLYDHVRSTVLDGLRREWQRYGWEDSEIDDKVDKLAKLWTAALHSTGAVSDPPQPPQPAASTAAADEEKDEAGVDGKRKRKRDDKPGEKRFKSGPRVDAPLTYQTFPPAASAAASSAQPAALASGYVPRFSSPAPSPPPQPPSTATTLPPIVPHMPASDVSAGTHRSSLPPASSQPPSSASLTTAVTASAAAPASSPFSSVKPESVTLPPPLSAVPFSASSSTDNPLLTEPLSVLDDDSDVDVDMGSVKDVLLCQYERVQHQKGRWKVVMRDGIVSVKGKEYAFSRLTGELQW